MKKNTISNICHSSGEQRQGKGLGQGRGGEKKASYFGPNIPILREIHLYVLLASSNESKSILFALHLLKSSRECSQDLLSQLFHDCV